MEPLTWVPTYAVNIFGYGTTHVGTHSCHSNHFKMAALLCLNIVVQISSIFARTTYKNNSNHNKQTKGNPLYPIVQKGIFSQ